MTDPEKQANHEKKSDSFLDNISNALNYLKNKIKPQKAPSEIKENIISKEQQESGERRMDLYELQKEVLINKEKDLINPELLGLHEKIVSNKKKVSQKQIPFQYIPNHIDTINWLQKNQDKRISAPWIAKSADDLRADIKGSSILNYFLA